MKHNITSTIAINCVIILLYISPIVTVQLHGIVSLDLHTVTGIHHKDIISYEILVIRYHK